MTLFDKWYSHYPRKKSPRKAERAFEKLNPDEAMVEMMIAAIQLQIKEREVRRQRGIWNPDWAYPATWLNNGCWEDEVDLDLQESKSPMEIAKESGIEARPGESQEQFEMRVRQTRH